MTSIAIINLILLTVRVIMYLIAVFKDNQIDRIEHSVWTFIHLQFILLQEVYK